MKIVVMSDTHLYRVNDDLKTICDRYCQDADRVIHLGDWVRGPILNYMEQYPLEAVAGNMDDHVIQNHLPAKKVIRLGGHRIGLIHGWGAASTLRSRLSQEFSNVDAIFFGHTHQPVQLQENGIFWFNPGSVFSGRGGSPPSLGIVYLQEQLRSEIVHLGQE